MKLDDPTLRATFSGRGRCEFCHTWSSCLHCAHVMSRGAGWCDIASNLVSLCYQCHASQHSGGYPTQDQLQAIAARREGVTVEAAIAEVHRIRRADKNGAEPRRRGA